ncbi:calcium-binding protein [uncultured Campylobacter sp.]|uniref:calcium-binding protein n=1 Tax=uncultured Campylobacter sp. TaxID=218934 RepID=UPI002610E51F|nr:calcium-binding protein [uncultured Campylobacter sp.]
MDIKNREEQEQKFVKAISDYFGITENGEIKPGAFAKIAKLVYDAIWSLIKAMDEYKLTEINAFEVKSAGVGIIFDLISGTIETTLDSGNRSGATKEYYAKPDIHFRKLVLKGLVTGAAEILIGKKVKLAGQATSKLVKFAGNFIQSIAISEITGEAFDKFFGAQLATIDFTKSEHDTKVLERKYLIQDTLGNALDHYWNNIYNDMKTLERTIIKTEDLKEGEDMPENNIVYYRKYPKDETDTKFIKSLRLDDPKDTYIIEILKRVKQRDILKIIEGDDRNDAKVIVANYLSDYGSNTASILSDLTSQKDFNDKEAGVEIKGKEVRGAASYCLQYLEGYALKGHKGATEYEELTKYSEQHIQDRAKFFSLVVSERIGNSPSGDEYFTEVKNGKVIKSAGNELNKSGDMANTEVVFVDGKNPSMELSAVDRRIYGYDRDDTIVYKYGNNYIESGLGSDTITTGKGSDTIYTNANIDVKYDQEDNSVKNTVHAGAGNDIVYGSKGMDEIYGEDDNDTIYGGGGDDKIYGGEGNDTLYADDTARGSIDTSLNENRLYGGAGDDTLIGGAGTDYLYAEDEKDDIPAHYSSNDVLDGKGGNDFLYGSTAKCGYSKMQGGVGNDTFYCGRGGMDTMNDEEGDDTYYAGNWDTINDNDGIGKVFFNNILLVGGKYDKTIRAYVDRNDPKITYKLSEGEKILTVYKGMEKLTIKNFHKENNSLGIELLDPDEISIKIGDNKTSEGDTPGQSLDFNILLEGNITDGEFLILGVGDKEYLFGNPSEEYIKKYNLNLAKYERGNTYTYKWNGNTIKGEDREFEIRPRIIKTSDKLRARISKYGYGTIIDDDRDPNEDLPETYDPIVIDFNKNGVTSTRLDNTVYFDHDNNGFAEATAWVEKDDGLLALDKNNNGKIDNGNELFGNHTISNTAYGYTDKKATNGYEALKAYDLNGDNAIDEKDEIFNKLKIWKDKNSNGITDEGELSSLADNNIKSIDLNYKEIAINENSNTVKQSSKVTLKDGSTLDANDVWMKVNLNKTEEIIDQSKLSPEVQALPQVIASGNLNSLRVAAGKNEKLATIINLYLMLSPEDRKKHIDELIYEWAGVSDMHPNSRTTSIDSRIVNVYEKLTGKPFTWHGSSNDSNIAISANIIKERFDIFKRYVYSTIELQTTYSDMDLNLDLMHLGENGKLRYKFDGLNSKLMQLYKDEKYNEIVKLIDNVRDTSAYKPIFQENLKENLSNFCVNDDKLLSLCFNAYISGTDSNDVISGNSEDNFIVGGKGKDTINGGAGDDTYVFARGDGNDIIYDTMGNDKIQFREGITHNDVSLKRELDKLIISIKNNNDSITIQNFFSVNPEIGNNTIRTITFADGTVYDLNKILELTPLSSTDKDDKLYLTDGNDTFDAGLGNDEIWGGNGDDIISGNEGNDVLYGNDGNDTINGNDGNDELHGDGGNDQLFGGDGNDTLYGENGNDTLIGGIGGDNLQGGDGNDTLNGGLGDDTLNGGYGDDTYIFNKGDGNDIITDCGGINTLQFGEGISRSDLEFNVINSASDLKISFKNSSNDSIIINQANIKNIKFAGGEILNLNDINVIKITGTEGSDVIRAGINIPHIIEGDNGNDIIRGNDYTKSISGGKGNDKLYGGSGDNIYIFNKGDGADTIYDTAGNDKIKFRESIAPGDISFKRELDKLIISIKGDGETINDSIAIQNFFSINPEIGNNTVRTITFADGTVYDFNKILELTPLSSTDKDDKLYLTDGNDTFDAGLGNDEIWSGNGDDIINGGEGGDTLYGNDGNDTLNGGNGNDTLYGGHGNDTIAGGEGDDILYGGFGDDTYIFNKGDGNDIITDDEGVDTIKFGKGILKEDLIISRSNAYNVIVQFKNNPGDKITLNRINLGNIEKFKFDDGTIMDLNDIKAKSNIGTQNDDIIYGYDEEDNILKGGGGNDTLIGGRRNDIIEGDEGNDVLRGNSGNDTLIGGSGDDVLCGGYGDDTYIFNKGDGNDIIDDDQGDDTIKFGEGISKEDLIISRRNAYNTIVRFKNNPGDTITLNNLTYIDLNNLTYIERFEFADGTFMNLNDIKTKSLVGTQDDDVIYGYDGDSILKGGGGNDSLIGGKGNDIIEGDEGDDWLFGNHGNDTLTGGSGNDILKGSDGDDIYIFNKGDGNDTIYDENGKDTIKFNDFNAEDITLKREFKNLIISSKISKDVITINDFFNAYNGYDYAIENIIFKDGSIWDYKAILDNSAIKATEGDDKICLGNGDDNFNALGGDDEICGEDGNDTIAGGNGNDKLDGGEGDDILYGNKGDDILSGGNGNDTLNGGDGDDKLYGWDGDDTIVGENGNDILNGGNGSDILNGGSGNDILNGDGGNDTLIGEKDSDILNGGYGDDTYIFNKGDGNDTITDNQGTDTIKFGEGISKEDLIVKRVARMNNDTKRKEYSDIAIFFKNSPNDSITLRDAAYSNAINENNIIETFEFANGGKLNFEDIKKLSLIGSDSSENIVGYVHTHNIIKGEGGDDKLYGQGWNDTMYGGDGNDLIEGGSGNDTLIGGKGDDALNGDIGDDILIGGTGDDTLNGDVGDDTYVFNKGDGNDIIEEWDGIDTIKFGEGIQKEDLIVSTNINKKWSYLNNATDIIIKFKHNEADSITLKNVLTENKTRINGAIENFEFANGEKLNFEDIKQLSLVGTNEGETINGFEDSNNTLIGNGGNDWLYGDNKNDILIGGEGDDHLRGSRGDDTYIYNIGDGNDTIHDYEGEDIIKFGKGINKEDIVVTKGEVKYDSYTRSRYQDLVISLKGKQGSISMEYIISEDGGIYEKYSHKTLVFENGDKLSFEDILKISLIGNDEDNNISGYNHRDNILEGNGGDDILCGNSGNDTLIGGDGNDGLNGEKGNDILIGGRGNDNLYGGSGDDTYVYNKGDGVDYIYDIEGNDTLKFGKGIKKEDLVISVSKNKEKLSQYDDTHRVMDIKIGFKNNDTDAVFLRGNIIDKCSNKDLTIENFEFENGDRLSFEDIKKLALTGDDTNNLLYGYDDINNVMNGLGGDDEIQGGELNDTIYGGEGNDTINGGSGDDIIEGGKGDDVIKGSWGNNTYIFNIGDGNDTIADYEGTDTLQLGEGITKDDIIVKHTPEGTIIKFKNSKNDSISLGRFGIERVKFANGEELSSEDIEKLELIGTDEADTIFGNSDQDNLIIGGKGDDILYGSYSGNNTFVYNQGDGADTIYAGTHENKIKFGKGINKEDLIVERCVNTDARGCDNLKISFRNSAGDSIMLADIINDNINAQEIQTFEFANGDKLNFGDIKKLSLIGTDKNDELRGYNDMDNEIKGGNGDDILIGGNGVNNILEGGSGNDTLRGCYDSYGNPDISMNGKNTFVFSRGDGNDMVENFKDNDLIKFKNIGSNEVKFNLNLVDNSLLISDKLSNSSVLIKNYNVRTNLNFQFKDGKILGSDFISGQVKPIDGGNTMVGGKEDNVFIYDGGAKTIMDLGGYDKVIYKNPVKRVRYDFGKNGSSDLKLIITPADPNAKNDILEVKGFFSNRDNVIEEFHIGKYLNIKAADIYKAFGKTYIASAKPATLAMNAKLLDIDNEAQISLFFKSSDDVKPATLSPRGSVYSAKSDENEVSSTSKETNEHSLNSKSNWDMVLGGDKNKLKAIVSKYCDDSNLNTPDLNSNLSVSNAMDLNSAPGVIQEEALKDNAFLSQDTVNKIIEQLNVYADNSEALEFNQRDIRKDDMQVYMS